ncbi:MAG TPA: NIPSNAP family protein [Rhizomicrobium sp.]|jgi:hypothetical protein|nr:NIPSNAP family protein [Rhizomicrobium sp.]
MNNIVELRQYAMKPGRRDELIELFEREFIESQEALGMDVIGTFRDVDDADRFVWLRGYADMESRGRALPAFYSGPVWKEHRNAAVATMNDTDNVLLLRPAWQGSGFSRGTRAPRGADEARQNLVVAMICYFDTKVPAGFAESFCDAMRSEVEAEGSSPLAAVVSEQSANNFPAHPIREGEHVFVWFQDFPNARTARSIALAPELTRQLCKPVEILRLRPTSRSRRMASSTMLCRSSA